MRKIIALGIVFLIFSSFEATEMLAQDRGEASSSGFQVLKEKFVKPLATCYRL